MPAIAQAVELFFSATNLEVSGIFKVHDEGIVDDVFAQADQLTAQKHVINGATVVTSVND